MKAADSAGLEAEHKSIAVIHVRGTLVHRTGGLSAMSGLVSYERIRADFRAALADPEVRVILFVVDSPGGEVAGVFDLVDEEINRDNARADQYGNVYDSDGRMTDKSGKTQQPGNNEGDRQ